MYCVCANTHTNLVGDQSLLNYVVYFSEIQTLFIYSAPPHVRHPFNLHGVYSKVYMCMHVTDTIQFILKTDHYD